MVALPNPPDSLDLVALSDIAWSVVDPLGIYEQEERSWVELLPSPAPPAESTKALASSLDAVVATLADRADAGRLRLIVALMCFLAAHPEHRELDEGLIQAALEEAFAPDAVPAEIAAALEQRADALDARVRVRPSRHPAPHAERQRPAPELEL